MTKKSLCVVTGTRAEYGLLRPVLQKLLQSDVIEPRLVVTGAHLAPEFGNTVSEIEADGMPIAARIPILKFGTGSPLATARTVSYTMERFTDYFSQNRPDAVLVLGDRYEIFAAGAAAALVLFCTVTLPPPDLSRTSMQMVKTLFTGLLHPNWELFFRLDSSGLAYLLLETVAIALVGTCVGAVFSVPLAFLGSSRFFPAPAAWLFRTLVTAIRSVPFLIYGLIFIRVCGPGSFTGVLTLAVCSVGLLCKRFTEAIDTLDFRAYHALEAMGTPKLSCVRHAALPQLVPQFFSAWLYRFDVNIREASALGLAGAGGIGAPLILALNQYAWHDVSTLALGMIALSWLVDLVSAFCRRRDA